MKTTSEQILEDAIFRIGTVVSVKGRVVEVKVDKAKNSSHLLYRGDLLRNISVGGYIKIVKGFTVIIGKVEGEVISEDKTFKARSAYTSKRDKINRILTVSLLGFFKGRRFERGIKEMPLIDNECFLLHRAEFEHVHDFIKDKDEPITLGSLSFEKGQEIRVGVNGLFASHIGIFGNTGSGKSYTLAKIYRELFLKYGGKAKFKRNARFFLIDFNGEYSDGSTQDHIIVAKRYKKTYCLSTRTETGRDKFPLAAETLCDPDLWVVFLEATEKTQAPFLRRAVGNSYVAARIRSEEEFRTHLGRMIHTATTSGDRNLEKGTVTNLLSELSAAFGGNQSLNSLVIDYRANLHYHNANGAFFYQNGATRIYSDNPNGSFEDVAINQKLAQANLDTSQIGLIDEIRLQIVMQYYDDIIRGFANREHLAPLIKRLDKRIDELKKVVTVSEDGDLWQGKNIVVVSLRDVSMRMRKIVPLLLCQRLYSAKKEENDSQRYLNIIVDEAHNILSEQSERESEQWKDYRLETFEEMIKEGRKFGVFLTLASQRPADVSPTIISQLHNYFLHRLINNEDINAVKQTISYLDRVSFEYLPLLPTGTCILAGLLANVPIVLDVGRIEPKIHEPRSKTITLADKWR